MPIAIPKMRRPAIDVLSRASFACQQKREGTHCVCGCWVSLGRWSWLLMSFHYPTFHRGQYAIVSLAPCRGEMAGSVPID